MSFHFHLICWLYHICHSTSIWYVECIISVIPLLSDMLSVSYLSFHFHLICWAHHMEVEWQIWYSQPIRWKWNDRYDTVNTSIGSGMTYMIQSTHQMEVEWHIDLSLYLRYTQCIYTLNIISENMIPLFLFIIFCFIQVRLIFFLFINNDIYDAVNTSDGSGMTDMIESTYQMEVEWHMIHSTYQMEVEWQIW
jgi:hypothetical protein